MKILRLLVKHNHKDNNLSSSTSNANKMKIEDVIMKIIHLPVLFYDKSINLSHYSLKENTGYFEVYDEIDEEKIQNALKKHPELIDLWLRHGDDYKGNPSNYIGMSKDSIYYIKIDSPGKIIFASDDVIEVCAHYIKMELERTRGYYFENLNKKKTNIKTKNVLMEILKFPVLYYDKSIGLSMYSLIENTGYFEAYDKIDEEKIYNALKKHPKFIEPWLNYGYDYKGTPCLWVTMKDNKYYLKQEFLDRPMETIFVTVDVFEICAHFIMMELERTRGYYFENLNKKKTNIKTKNVLMEILKFPVLYYDKSIGLSMYSLIENTGYFEAYDKIDEEKIYNALKKHPKFIEPWLNYGYDYKGTPCLWVTMKDNKYYLTKEFKDRPMETILVSVDVLEVCARFIILELESIRDIYLNDLKKIMDKKVKRKKKQN